MEIEKTIGKAEEIACQTRQIRENRKTEMTLIFIFRVFRLFRGQLLIFQTGSNKLFENSLFSREAATRRSPDVKRLE